MFQERKINSCRGWARGAGCAFPFDFHTALAADISTAMEALMQPIPATLCLVRSARDAMLSLDSVALAVLCGVTQSLVVVAITRL